MKNSGVAIMGTGIANGPNRAQLAVEEALNSPLLDNNDINGAGNLLLYISSGKNEITMDEVTEITDYIQEKTKSTGDIIWGNGFDANLDDRISVTIVATGFDDDHKQKGPSEPETVKVHTLYDNNEPRTEKRIFVPEPVVNESEELRIELLATPVITTPVMFSPETEPEPADPLRNIEFTFSNPEPEFKPEPAETIADEFHPIVSKELTEPQIVYRSQTATPPVQPAESDANDFQTKKAFERVSKLRQLSEKLKTHQPIEQNLYEIENIPAYKRRNVELSDVTPSSESQVSDYSLSENSDNSIELRSENRFLNKKVD
jgi:cell division protein FtsZ